MTCLPSLAVTSQIFCQGDLLKMSRIDARLIAAHVIDDEIRIQLAVSEEVSNAVSANMVLLAIKLDRQQAIAAFALTRPGPAFTGRADQRSMGKPEVDRRRYVFNRAHDLF